MHELLHNTQKKMSFNAYRKMKLKMLKEFYIKLTDEQLAHMNELTTEIAIDNFCISLIRNGVKTYEGN